MLVFFLFLQTVLAASGQTIERKVIASGAVNYDSPLLSVSSTLGETFIATLNSPGLLLTQGFQQPTRTLCNLALTIDSSNIRCHGDSSGWINITLSGGTGPYSIVCNGTDTSVISGNTFLLDTLTAGQYVITVSGTNNCSVTDTVLLTEPSELQAQAVSDPIVCYGETTDVVVTALGGTLPYTGMGVFPMYAGSYSFTIIDSLGCSVVVEDSISSPSELLLTATPSAIPCHGDSSIVAISAAGGVMPYQETGEYLLPAGTHTVTVSDANGCESSISVTLSEPPALKGTSTASTILCAGELSSVQVTASGGTAPYTGTGTVEVPAGLYAYLITDANGCQLIDSILINEPAAVNATATLSTPIACYGGTGSVTVTASGGTAPYVGAGTQLVAEGSWTFAVTDANGCTAVSNSVEVIAPSKVTVSYTFVPATCNLANGSITVTVSGGTAPYMYAWSSGQTTSTVSNLLPGTYSVVVSDSKGCTEGLTVVLPSNNQPLGPTGTIVGPRGACRGTSVTYSLPVVANATNYVWSLPAGTTGNSNTNSITVTFSSNYAGGFVCVTPTNACATGAQTCANVPVLTVKPPSLGTITVTGITCGPSIVTCSVAPVSGATSYTWSVAGTQASIVGGQGTNAAQISLPAGFTNARVAVFASNCVGSNSSVFYTLIGVPVNSATLTGQTYICPNSVQNYSITSVLGATSYVWSISGSASITSSSGTSCTLQTLSSWSGGTLTVAAVNSCGSSSRSFTLRSVPLQPGAMSGPMNGLCAYNGVTTASYSIAAVTGATSYNWSVPPGMSIRNTNGTSMTVNIDTSFRTGSICVAPVNACGQGTSRCMAVNAYPLSPGTINGPASVCKSDRAVDYTISPVTGAYHYVWAISGGAYLVTVSTGLTSTVDYYWALTGSALLSVKSSNLCGSSQPQQKNISVNLACRLLGDGMAEAPTDLLVYPNPAHESIRVSFDKKAIGSVSIQVLDILGRSVAVRRLEDIEIGSQQIEIPLDREKISSGMYMLRLIDGDRTEDIRLIVE